ncbi:hypothetical protein KM043_001130 [Ampulex compressa]|nr:hypothetical protein KM043_001130 [Ampulex compressa]
MKGVKEEISLLREKLARVNSSGALIHRRGAELPRFELIASVNYEDCNYPWRNRKFAKHERERSREIPGDFAAWLSSCNVGRRAIFGGQPVSPSTKTEARCFQKRHVAKAALEDWRGSIRHSKGDRGVGRTGSLL